MSEKQHNNALEKMERKFFDEKVRSLLRDFKDINFYPG